VKFKGRNVQPVFIVGHGRSGTIHLAKMMDKHKDVFATIEHPRPLFRDLNEAVFYPSRHHLIPSLLEKKKQHMGTHHNWRFSRTPFWVEKNNQMVLIQDIVESAYPSAFILHIIRNPFDVYCSSIPHLGLMSWFPLVDKVFGCGGSKYMGTTTEIEEKYSELEITEKIAYKWISWVKAGLQWQKTSNRVFTLTYEDMVTNPRKTFGLIGEFTGLEKDQKWLKSVTGLTHSRSVNRHKRDMKQQERTKMNNIISGFLDEHDILKQYKLTG